MKDKILDIVAEHCVGWKNCEALTEKLFDLYSDSQQRELFINFTKKVIKYYEEMYIGDYDLYKEATALINNLNESKSR